MVVRTTAAESESFPDTCKPGTAEISSCAAVFATSLGFSTTTLLGSESAFHLVEICWAEYRSQPSRPVSARTRETTARTVSATPGRYFIVVQDTLPCGADTLVREFRLS